MKPLSLDSKSWIVTISDIKWWYIMVPRHHI